MTDALIAPRRRAIPLSAKLHACLLMLGYSDEQIKDGVEWDHCPALWLRDVVDGEWVPHQHDPRYISPLSKAEHRKKTFGVPATAAGSDAGNRAKVKRIRDKLLAPAKPKPLRKRAWPKRKMQGRKRS